MSKSVFVTVLCVVLINRSVLSTDVCPDITALHDVSAYFNDEVSSFSGYEASVDFYLLENQTIIHVVRANVSVLCEGMVNSFRYLQKLALINANISKILPEAFKQVPRLTSLSLAVNHLTTISKDQFKNLNKLTVLYLSANEIATIDEDAFSELTNLKKIYLDKNRIAEINGQWFSNNHYLSLINLAYNNITAVQQEAFVVRKGSSLELRLQHNVIEKIEPRAVASNAIDAKDRPRVTIFMDNNNITQIPDNFIGAMSNFQGVIWSLNSNLVTCVPDNILEELKNSSIDLRLNNNPLNCPCMQDITNFMSRNTIGGNFEFTSVQECYLYGVQTPPEWNLTR